MNPAASCQGKSRFETWIQANKTAERMNRRKSQEDHMGVYRCKVCRGFHVGRMDRQERRVNKQDRRRFFERTDK